MSIGSAIRTINGSSASALPIPWTKSTKDGYTSIVETPSMLAAKAGIDVNELALAACVSSEVGSLPAQYLYAVGEAINNEAVATGQLLVNLLAGGGKAPGHFGQQSGRFAATTQPPTFRSLAAARQARLNSGNRFTKGARRFLDLKVHDAGFQAGKPIASPETILRSRYNDGWKWVGPLHDPETGEWLIDSYILFLMSRDGKYTLQDSLDELEASRRRWKIGGPSPSAIAPQSGAGLLLIAAAGIAAVVEIL